MVSFCGDDGQLILDGAEYEQIYAMDLNFKT
jgi:hypothetical protein